MKKIFLTLSQTLLIIFFCWLGQTAYAADFYWRRVASDGNLNNMANWELNASGSNVLASGAPGPDDNVFFTVVSNKQVLQPVNEFNCKNLTFASGLNYTLSQISTLNIYGNLVANGSFTVSNTTLQFCSEGSASIDMGTDAQKISGGKINFIGSGTYSLVGHDLITSSAINFESGNFASNGKKLRGGALTIPKVSGSRNLNFSTSTIQASIFRVSLMDGNQILSQDADLEFTSSNQFYIDEGSQSARSIEFKSITYSPSSKATIYLYEKTAFNNEIKTKKWNLNNNALSIETQPVGLIISADQLNISADYDVVAQVPNVTFRIGSITTSTAECAGSTKSFTNKSTGVFELKSINNQIEVFDFAFKGITFSGEGFKAPASNNMGQNSGLIFWSSSIPVKTYYWIGGAGDWHMGSNWSFSSGGSPANCIPTGNDHVQFDSNSFTGNNQSVTINSSQAFCNNITWSDNLKRGKLEGQKSLVVRGSADYSGCKEVSASIDYTGSGTVTSGGVIYTSPLISFIHDGSYSLMDNLVTSADVTTININSGTFISNGKKIVANKFLSTSLPTTVVRNIDMSNSDIQISSEWNIWSDKMTSDFTGSHIQVINPEAKFVTRGEEVIPVNYNKVTFSAITGQAGLDIYNFTSKMSSPNYVYIDQLFFNSDANVSSSFKVGNMHLIRGKIYVFTFSYNVYITGNIQTSGSLCDLAIIKSSSPGTRAIFVKPIAPFVVEGVNIKDIAATAAVPLTVVDGVDSGNNRYVSVSEVGAKDFYWVGGSGNWSDGSHWSIAISGENPAITNASLCIPRSVDNVFFDENSFTNSSNVVTLDIDGQCNNMKWTTEAGSKTPTFVGNSKKLTIDGSVDFAFGIKFNDRFDLSFNGNSTTFRTQYLNTHKANLDPVYVYFWGTNRFEFKEDVKCDYLEIHCSTLNGGFVSNGHTIDVRSLRVLTGGPIDITGSTIRSASAYWNFITNHTGKQLKSDDSHISVETVMNLFVSAVTDTAQFNNITFLSPENNKLNAPGSTLGRINIRKLEFKGNSVLEQVNVAVDTLVYARSSTNTIDANRTLIVNDTLIGYGTKCNTLTIQSSTADLATIKSGKCNINIPFATIKNIKADINGCTSDGYHVLANNVGALQNSPGWSVTALGSLSLLGIDTTLNCSGFNYIQETKDALGVGEKYEWFYNGQPYGGNTDTIHIKKPGVYSLRIEYAPGCFIDEAATRRTFNLETAPVVTCPGNRQVTANLNNVLYEIRNTTFDATVIEDNCELASGIKNVWYTLSGATVADSTSATTLQGVRLNVGVTTVTWYAEDNATPSHVNYCSFTITVGTVVNPNPNPNPNPEPEKPKPGDKEAGIKLESGQIICAEDQTATISVEVIHKGELQYIIRFSAEAHAVGIQDQVTYQSLPSTGTVSFAIPANTPSGTYQGILVLKGDTSSNLITDYPFTFEILSGAKITKQPSSVTNICDTDNFTLTVEATGDELAYQWYFNGKQIVGANESIYEGKLSVQTEGSYKVEVISVCDRIFSDEVTVSGGALRILKKWDDVLYIMNADKRYISFQWYKDNIAINPFGTAVFYTDEKNGLNGTYKVRAFKADGSYDESCTIFVVSQSNSASVSVYPNPVLRNSTLTVQLGEVEKSTEKIAIDIYDASGRRIYKGQARGVNTEILMDAPIGAYIVKISFESGKIVTQKLLVK